VTEFSGGATDAEVDLAVDQDAAANPGTDCITNGGVGALGRTVLAFGDGECTDIVDDVGRNPDFVLDDLLDWDIGPLAGQVWQIERRAGDHIEQSRHADAN
jgi:hypothetical protein